MAGKAKRVNFFFLSFSVFLLVIVQLLIKYRFTVAHGEIPISLSGFWSFLLNALRDPYLWVAGILLITAATLWYMMISRMSLGVAFTFAALSYPLVMVGSYLFLGEVFALPQILGCGLIVAGLIIIAVYS